MFFDILDTEIFHRELLAFHNHSHLYSQVFVSASVGRHEQCSRYCDLLHY